MFCELGRSEEGLAALQQAVRIHEKLAADFHSVPSYRHGLATSLMNLSILQAEMGRRDEGLATCGKAIGILETLCSESPKIVAYQEILALTYRSQGELHRASNQFEPALASLPQGTNPSGEAGRRESSGTADTREPRPHSQRDGRDLQPDRPLR
jgi:tetratricopeptide (TPR) repeat protein